jgi:hypothetical protein
MEMLSSIVIIILAIIGFILIYRIRQSYSSLENNVKQTKKSKNGN